MGDGKMGIEECLRAVDLKDYWGLKEPRFQEYLDDLSGVYGSRCDFFGQDRSKGTLVMVYRGRMANVLLQYLWGRIRADGSRWGLEVKNKKNQKNQSWVNPIGHYPNVQFGSVPNVPPVTAEVAGVAGCGPHFQSYEYYRHERCVSACLFSPQLNSLHERLFTLGPNDVVIHFREPIELMVPYMNRANKTRPDTVPPWSYFYNILHSKRVKGELGQVWIVRQHSKSGKFKKHNGTIHKSLLDEFGAKLAYGESEQDHYLARNAPIFIGSFGTYSWTIAYLSSGRELHLPYDSRIDKGSTWNRWNEIFIDDDPRLRYHDCFLADPHVFNHSFSSSSGKHPPWTFETAAEVLARDTPFSKSAKSESTIHAKSPCQPRRFISNEGNQTSSK